MNKKRYWLKLLLNIAIIAVEVLVIYSGYMLFTHKWEPIQGVLLFLGIIALLYFSLKMANRRGFHWHGPSLAKTTLVILAITVICTFAGVEPMATYKNSFFEGWQARQDEWKERAKREPTPTLPPKEESIPMPSPAILDLEDEVLLLVNLIRADRGTDILIWDDGLYKHSKTHSENMASREEMFHSSMNLPYAENAWYGAGTRWKASDIVGSWLSSEKHRTWLLCPHLKHIAVGIATSEDRDTYASWTFWRKETLESDWWYVKNTPPPDYWEPDWVAGQPKQETTTQPALLSGIYKAIIWGVEQSWTFKGNTVIRFDPISGQTMFEYSIKNNHILLQNVSTGEKASANFEHDTKYNFIIISDITYWKENT